VTRSGKTYDVLHPEFIWIGKRTAHVGLPIQPDDTEWDRYHEVAILHVTAIEHLSAPTNAT
jgi:hypothetical protein